MPKLRIGCVNAQYMRKILSQCATFAQDCTFSPMRNIVLISPMRNICARLYLFPQCAQDLTQDCTYFLNAQYMRNICARLYLFPQCTIYAKDLCKIVLISPMRNICAKLQALLEETCHISHICSKLRMVFTLWLFLDCHKL